MAELPTIPNRIAHIDQTQPRVSRQDIEAPYAALAKSLNTAGEVVSEDIAVPLAERAGAESVRLGDDGKMVVDKGPLPMVGDAGKAFKRASSFAYLAKIQPEIEAAATKMRLANPNDPDGLKRAGDAYVSELTKNISDPHLRVSVGKIAAENIAHNYKTSLVETDTTARTNMQTGLESRIKDIRNKMSDLAFQQGTETPEYQRAQSDLATMYGELGKDPRYGYPKERIASELSQRASQDKVQWISGQAVKIFDSGKPTAKADARKWLVDKIYNDPNLNMTMAERHTAVTNAVSILDGRSSENKALIDVNKKITKDLITQADTQDLDITAANNQIQRSIALGDLESAMYLQARVAANPSLVAFRNLPDSEKPAALRLMKEGSITSRVPADMKQVITDAAARAGVPAEYMLRTAGRESGFNPNAQAGTSSAGGLFQFTDRTWAATLRDYGAKYGLGPDTPKNNAQANALMAAEFTKANAGALKEAGLPVSEKTLYLAHFAGAAGATKLLTADPASSAAGVLPGAAAANRSIFYTPDGAARSVGQVINRLTGDRASTQVGAMPTPQELYGVEAGIHLRAKAVADIKGAAGRLLEAAEKQQGRSENVSESDLLMLGDLVHSSEDQALRSKYETLVKAKYGIDAVEKIPNAAVRSAVMGQFRAGVGGIAEQQVSDRMVQSAEAMAEQQKKLPYTTGGTRKLTNPPKAFRFDDPAAVGAVATERLAAQQVLRNYDGGNPISIFEGPEGEAARNALVNGDPKVAAATLAQLQGLPPDVYKATMASDPMKAALTGMVHSRDPVRMTAGMVALDKYWEMDPSGFKTVFGDDPMTHLQAWQGLKDSFTPAEIAERLNLSDDPAKVKARGEMKALAETETKNYHPEDVAYQLGTGWPITPNIVSRRVTGATADVPYDEGKARELAIQFKDTYSALRSFGVPADKAKELTVKRLKTEWGPSVAAGGQLMQYPPDKYYGTVNGSHDWMRADLIEHMTKQIGPQVDVLENLAGGGDYVNPKAPYTNWAIVGLMTDKQTQAEISAKQPPSYKVAYRNNVGLVDVLPDRVTWNRAPHVAAATFEARQREEAMNTLMPMGGSFMDPEGLRPGPGSPLMGAGPAPAAPGQVEPGNINLDNRPIVKNADGSISTVRSMSIGVDGKEVLIPTVSDDGRILTPDEAIAQYKETGKHLGVFDTVAHATAYAKKLSSAQGRQYVKPSPP